MNELIAQKTRPQQNASPPSPPVLSARQRQILDCLVRGYHNKTIAYQLGIEVVTVKMHLGLLFKKLGVTNRTAAAIRGMQLYVQADAPLLE